MWCMMANAHPIIAFAIIRYHSLSDVTHTHIHAQPSAGTPATQRTWFAAIWATGEEPARLPLVPLARVHARPHPATARSHADPSKATAHQADHTESGDAHDTNGRVARAHTHVCVCVYLREFVPGWQPPVGR